MEQSKPQIIYIVGGPGSGKGTQCEKLVKDFKFTHISTGDIMRWEVQNKTPEGLKLEEIMKRGELASTEMTVGLLMKAIKRLNGRRYLIDGFPRGLEQALYLEQHYDEIEYILSFDANDEIILGRLLERAKTSGRADDNPETIKKRIDKFNSETKEAIQYYTKFSKVNSIDALGTIEQCYSHILKVLRPRVIFLYGAPGTGITTIAQCVANHMNWELIEAKKFFQQRKLDKASDELKTKSLVAYLRDNNKWNFIIEGFPETKLQASIYYEHFNDLKFIYLQMTKDEAECRISELFGSDKKKAKQKKDELLKFVSNKPDILKFVSKNPTYLALNNIWDSYESIEERIINVFTPTVYFAFDIDKNSGLMNAYLKEMEKSRGFLLLDYENMINQEIRRGTNLGKLLKENPNDTSLILNVFKKIYYGNPCTKRIVLYNFPETSSSIVELFEDANLKVAKILLFVPNSAPCPPEGANILDVYNDTGKIIIIDEVSLDYVDNHLEPGLNYGLVAGPNLSGKTVVADYLAKSHQVNVLKFDTMKEQYLKKKNPDGGDNEEASINDILTYAMDIVKAGSSDKLYFLDGFAFTKELYAELFAKYGTPKIIIFLQATPETLELRYIKKNEVNEVPEEEKENIKANLVAANEFNDLFELKVKESKFSEYFKVNAGLAELYMLEKVNKIFQKRVCLLRFQDQSVFDESVLRECLAPICLSNDFYLVDIPKVIKHYNTPGSIYAEQIYCDLNMNSGNLVLSPKLLMSMIQSYLKEKKCTKRDILLYNFQNTDHEQENKKNERKFTAPIDDLFQITSSLGTLRVVIDCGAERANLMVEDPIEEKKFVEPVKPKAPAEENESEKPQSIPPPEEGEETVKKFNPDLYSWYSIDVPAKSLGQLFTRSRNSIEVPKNVGSDQEAADNIGEVLKTLNQALERGDDEYCYVSVVKS